MPNLPQAALLEALGWTIVNSWWQFGILWLLFLFIKKVLPGMRSAQRYNLLLVLLMIGLSWTLLSFLIRLNADDSSVFVPVSTLQDNLALTLYGKLHYWAGLTLPYLSLIYLIWLFFKLLQFTQQLWKTHQVTMEGLVKAPVKWRIFLESISGQMNISPRIRLWLTEKIDTPMIIGCLKPMILLPVSAFNQLNTEQLEAILIHELAHIKRNDYFWNLLVALAELVMYHNPFARLLINAIREEREHSCDDLVLQFPFIPAEYADALLQLEKNRRSAESRLLVAARGNSRKVLLIRVQRMLNMPVSRQKTHWKVGLLASVAGLLGFFALVGPGKGNSRLVSVPTIVSPAVSQPGTFQEMNGLPLIKEASDPVQASEMKDGDALFEKLASRQGPGISPGDDTAGGNVSNQDAPGTSGSDINERGSQLLWVANEKEFARYEKALAKIETETKAYTLNLEKINRPEEASFLYQLPYVPKNSFQASGQADTLPDMANVEMLDLKAMEAALQVKLAMEQINWQRVLSELQEKGASVETMKLELEKSMAKLDWNRVREEAKTALRDLEESHLMNKLTTILQLQAEYEQQEAELKKLHKQLDHQQDLLKQQLRIQEQKLRKLPNAGSPKKKIVHI
ncbi:M56 family metallopeptidase [Flavihumibacter stibioxidans]|uniref:Peptidase M56 domain-containing protein n=1 Tax=Flavihumibacter stibioxidans TaxID=1834163 RepID=A0ABR7M4I6_9BACT|nr:M56 family metallopeptidase [Flavihumibacter stibioxidans]MBC6489907.1 hypothetical protein [Flavihumibacter stibioxidans]